MAGFIKHWRIGLLGIAVSLLAIYVVISKIDLALLHEALDTARFGYLIPAIFLLVMGIVARAFRWRLLLSGDLSVVRAFHIMNIAYLVNGVLPLRIGELARAYLALRNVPSVPVFKSISTVIVERLLDVLAIVMMVALALVSSETIPEELQSTGLFFGVTGISGFLFLIFLSHQRRLAQRLTAAFSQSVWVLRRFNLAQWVDQFLDGLLPLAHLRTLFGALLWTAISWGFSAYAGYILMYTFYDHADWGVTFLYIAAAAFAIAVPITLGNLGVYEASIVLVVMALGVGESETKAIAFAVTVHAANVGINVVTGIIGFIREGITLEQLSRGVSEIAEVDAAEVNELSQCT